MLTPIHRVLGHPPSGLTWELIVEAVEAQVEETADLDWKQSVYDHRNPRWQDEAAKDIAAMANSGGGWIVFGVAEDTDTSGAADITGTTWGQEDQQRMLRVAYTKIGPPVVGLEFHVISDPSAAQARRVVLMRVPDSADRPHLARSGEAAFTAPVRNGPHTVFMTDRDIERAFRDRFALSAEQEASLQALYEETAQHLDHQAAVSFVLVAVPVEPRHSSSEIDDRTLTEIFTPTFLGDFYAIPGNAPGSMWSTGDVRRGYRRWTRRSRERNRPAYRAIHENGTVQAGFRLGGLMEGEAAAPYYPVGEPNHCMSEHVEHALVESVAILRKWAIRLEVTGGYRVRTGLVGQRDQPIYIRTTEGWTNFLLDVDHAEPIHRFHPVTGEVDPLGPVEDLVPVVGEIALDLVNQGGVRHLRALRAPGADR